MGHGGLTISSFRRGLREFEEKIDYENIRRRLPFHKRAKQYNILI